MQEFENEGDWYLSHEYRNGSVGFVVETKNNLVGRTYHEKGMVNGKMPVYLDDKTQPVLCNPKTLLFISKITYEDERDYQRGLSETS